MAADPTDVIDALYEQLAQLNAIRTGSQESEARYQHLLQRLRRLQREEAEWMRVQFERELRSPLGSGKALLQQAGKLLAKHEDPSGSSYTS